MMHCDMIEGSHLWHREECGLRKRQVVPMPILIPSEH